MSAAGAARREPELTAAMLALASLTTVAVLLSLFLLRSLDDNRLTSWNWVFAPADFWRLFLFLVFAVLLAHLAGARALPVPRAAALAISAFGASALLWQQPEVIVDAARYFVQAKQIAQTGAGHFLTGWGGEIQPWTDLPLVPLLYGVLFAVFGEERLYLQVLNSFLFAGSTLLVWQIGRLLWSEEVGLAAGALLLGMPYLLVQVPLTLVDVPTMFFVTLAAWATLAALRLGGAARLGLAAGAVALASLSKYSAWLMLTVLPVLAWCEARGRRPDIVRRAAAIAGGALLLAAPVFLAMAEVVAGQLELLRDFQAPALTRWSEDLVSTFLFQIHPFITIAAVASLWLAWRARDRRYAAVAWLPMLVLALGIRRARYLVPLLPMIALMAACGLQALREAAVRRHVVLCIVASALAIVFCGYLPFLQRTSAANLAQAGAYLDTLDDEAIEVVALAQPNARINPDIAVPLLDLHTRKDLVVRNAPPPQPPDVASLPLRFTWEYRHPRWIADVAQDDVARPVAVIADSAAQDMPAWLARQLAQYRLARHFDLSEGVFGYQTQVSLFLPRLADER